MRACSQPTKPDTRKPNTRPCTELSGYAGAFEDEAHGRIDVKVEGDALKLDWGVHKGLALEHWHFDTFRIKQTPGLYRDAWGDRLLVFRFSAAGEVESFRYLGHDFRKVKAKK